MADTDLNLTPDDERQLREALEDAREAGAKDAFCRCWPAVKGLLQWLEGKLPPGKVKEVVARMIQVGDLIFGFLNCPQQQAQGIPG